MPRDSPLAPPLETGCKICTRPIRRERGGGIRKVSSSSGRGCLPLWQKSTLWSGASSPARACRWMGHSGEQNGTRSRVRSRARRQHGRPTASCGSHLKRLQAALLQKRTVPSESVPRTARSSCSRARSGRYWYIWPPMHHLQPLLLGAAACRPITVRSMTSSMDSISHGSCIGIAPASPPCPGLPSASHR